MSKFIILFMAFGLLLFSCKTKKVKETETPKETNTEVNTKKEIDLDLLLGSFYITSIQDGAELNDVKPTIQIEETGRISGFNGCNSFFGQIENEEQNLINNLGATRRACEGEDVERIMMETLREVTNITYDGVIIKFYSGDRVVMTGKKITLEGGSWQVISLEGKEYEQLPTFEVLNNRLNGSTGCNSFFGMIQQNGFKLKIAEPGMTEMVCEGFDTTMESKFMQALEKVTEMKKEGRFTIFSAQGKELFRAENPEQE